MNKCTNAQGTNNNKTNPQTYIHKPLTNTHTHTRSTFYILLLAYRYISAFHPAGKFYCTQKTVLAAWHLIIYKESARGQRAGRCAYEKSLENRPTTAPKPTKTQSTRTVTAKQAAKTLKSEHFWGRLQVGLRFSSRVNNA